MSDHCVHCDPLCRGNDKNPHGCGTAMWDQDECVGCRERFVIVDYLERSGPYASIANDIALGDHYRGEPEDGDDD